MLGDKKYVMGVDYSMTCPAACICLNEEEFAFEHCKFFFLTDSIKNAAPVKSEQIFSAPIPEYKTDEQRFDSLSECFMVFALLYGAKEVAIEGYAYGGSGVVFQIAENTGLLKHKLYKQNIGLSIYPPTRIKKFATENGRADKEMMYDAFIKETGVDLKSLLNYTKSKTSSPIGDIVDAYYICKFHFYNNKKLAKSLKK